MTTDDDLRGYTLKQWLLIVAAVLAAWALFALVMLVPIADAFSMTAVSSFSLALETFQTAGLGVDRPIQAHLVAFFPGGHFDSGFWSVHDQATNNIIMTGDVLGLMHAETVVDDGATSHFWLLFELDRGLWSTTVPAGGAGPDTLAEVWSTFYPPVPARLNAFLLEEPGVAVPWPTPLVMIFLAATAVLGARLRNVAAYLLIAGLAISSFSVAPAEAQICGIPPIPPIPQVGCSAMQPVCVCNERGTCWWQYVCVQ